MRAGRLHIEPNGKNILDGKMILAAKDQGEKEPVTIHKLLIGKIKECELKYSIIVEIYVV